MPMPRNGFDSLAAVARMNDDNTMHHRERWPSLDWVWDELDDLRADAAEAIDHDDHAALETERDAALDVVDQVVDQRDALSEAVRLLLEPEPDMERVQDILMGCW